MAEHRVKFSIPYRVLGRSDIKFKIYNHQRRHPDELLGTLFVSHGAIEWRPARKKNKIKLDWPDFDRRMQGA
jgi:hypothetical protein